MSIWMARPHRRLNPLTGEWVLVSPQRVERPWQGQIEVPGERRVIAYDPECYLCPGNARFGGGRNPDYTSTFVFDNDFPALLPEAPAPSGSKKGLLVAEPERGICRVVCFTPRHDGSLSSMSPEELTLLVATWQKQIQDLTSKSFINYVQIFENRGAVMGASNPHPHCQIWASECIPNEVLKEDVAQARYENEHHSCMLCDYSKVEDGERNICENDSFRVVVPFWAIWPFETLVIAKRHIPSIAELDRTEHCALGAILSEITRRYDALFGVPFPYSMGFHQSPERSAAQSAWHLHAHFYPPLLRSAKIRKFMVGYEMLASPQRDLTPEMAARRLRQI